LTNLLTERGIVTNAKLGGKTMSTEKFSILKKKEEIRIWNEAIKKCQSLVCYQGQLYYKIEALRKKER